MIILLLDLILPITVIFNLYLHFYPTLYGCTFPRTDKKQRAPFRLLALGDPQLEGDTSLWRYQISPLPPHPIPLKERVALELRNIVKRIGYHQKRLDLWGNDCYLAQVYRAIARHADPTHTTVLGDLLGSQWISDEEFNRRGRRFWNIFNDKVQPPRVSSDNELAIVEVGKNTLITLPGNHDIGYAGDMNRGRVVRYERMFGPANYRVDPFPGLRILVLNSMSLDTPIYDESLHHDSVNFLQKQHDSMAGNETVILLTHLPMWKPAGMCVDAPDTAYFHTGGIRYQNFLSPDMSNWMRWAVWGEKKRGIVVTGHDHEGCDTTHWEAEPGRWDVCNTEEKESKGCPKDAGIREITVRAMMGEYGGYSGMLSGWYDDVQNGESAATEFRMSMPLTLSQNGNSLSLTVQWVANTCGGRLGDSTLEPAYGLLLLLFSRQQKC